MVPSVLVRARPTVLRARTLAGRLADPADLAIPALLGAVTAFLLFVLGKGTVDDAFITWRYGQNLVHHHVWNYNPTGPRSEAYSNPIYALLSIIPALLRIPTELFFKVFGLAVMAGVVEAIHRARLPRWQAFTFAAVTLANPVFVIHLFSGLETTVHVLAVSWLFARIHRNGALDRRGLVLAFLVAMVRADAIIFVVVALALHVAIGRSRAAVEGAAAVLCTFGTYWAVRSWYFGALFPAPYYVKSGHRGTILHQLGVLWTNLVPALAVGACIGMFVWALHRDGRALRSTARFSPGWFQDAVPLVLALTGAAIVLGIYQQSDLQMNFVNRFLWQALFPVVLTVLSRPFHRREVGLERRMTFVVWAFAVTITAAVAFDPSRVQNNFPVLVAVVASLVAIGFALRTGQGRFIAAAAVGLSVALSYTSLIGLLYPVATRVRETQAHEALGAALAPYRTDGAIAYSDAGLLPYRADAELIDTVGLASLRVAKGKLTPKVLSDRKVWLVIINSPTAVAGPDGVNSPGSQTSWRYARNQSFWTIGGPKYTGRFYLNLWVDGSLMTDALRREIVRIDAAAEKANSRSDLDVVLGSLFTFPIA